MVILRRSKKIVFLLGVSIVLLGLYLVAITNPAYTPSAETVQVVTSAVEAQQSIAHEISVFYSEGEYTFTAPLVIQDPYRSAPLTALLLFETPQAAQISLHIPGKTAQADVDFTFAGYRTHHEIHVYGLYANTLNRVTLRLQTQAGETQQTEIQLQTEPLPVYLEKMQVDTVNRGLYSPGFNFTFLDHKTIFDIDGAVRWFSTQATFQTFTPLKNGRFLFTYPAEYNNILMEQDLLGKIYAIYNVEDGVHHDIFELPNGNLLLTSENTRSQTKEDYIFELERGTGTIVRFFDLKAYLDPGRPKEINSQLHDWFHLNSIVYDPADASILISGRFQSAVIKLSYPEMKIQWIMGPHEGWSSKFQPYLLNPIGENFEWQWSQHHATLLGAGLAKDELVDIQVFDNGLYRSFDLAHALTSDNSFSRVVHYRVNEKAMTVEQIWEYGKARGSSLFSNSLGSAYPLTNGNILGTWGEIARDLEGHPVDENKSGFVEAKIIEVDPTSSQVVFEATLPAIQNYRTFRAGLYDAFQVETSRLAEPLKDTSTNDLMDRTQLVWIDYNAWQKPH